MGEINHWTKTLTSCPIFKAEDLKTNRLFRRRSGNLKCHAWSGHLLFRRRRDASPHYGLNQNLPRFSLTFFKYKDRHSDIRLLSNYCSAIFGPRQLARHDSAHGTSQHSTWRSSNLDNKLTRGVTLNVFIVKSGESWLAITHQQKCLMRVLRPRR